jgi:protein TonB
MSSALASASWWRRIPAPTRLAYALSAAAHAATVLALAPLAISPARLGAFETVEVVLVSEPAPRLSLKSRVAAATPASPAAVPATDAAGQANEAAYVEPRYHAAALNNPRPAYPLAARRRGEEGKVVLRAQVTTEGRCAAVELKASSGHELLDRAALQTVSQWRFVPARRGDLAVASWVEVPVTFRLRDELSL